MGLLTSTSFAAYKEALLIKYNKLPFNFILLILDYAYVNERACLIFNVQYTMVLNCLLIQKKKKKKKEKKGVVLWLLGPYSLVAVPFFPQIFFPRSREKFQITFGEKYHRRIDIQKVVGCENNS